MQRTYIKDIKAGEKVLLKGWVHDIRELAKLRFVLLKDISGIVQCVAKGKIVDDISGLSLESVVELEGKVKKAQIRAEFVRKDVEVEVSSLKVLAKAEKLPFQVNEKAVETDISKRLDCRFLDLHRKKIQAIFKIQSTISMTFREHFIKKGFIEFQPPSIISSSSEGGTELFKAKYFEKDAFLAQSPQLYKQMVACSMEKAMTITPVWRAEKHNTVRHLNESRQMDIEMAFATAMDVLKQMEEVVKDIVKNVIEKNKEELKLLNVELKVPKAKYMTFEEVAELMKKEKIHIEKDDLTPEAEKKLGELFKDTIVFVHDWPLSGKPFYIMPKGEDAKAELSEGFDAIYKGTEISSGGQRIHIPELLIERLKTKKMNPKNFKSYIDSFRFGSVFHSGWSIGLERLTMLICGLNNIREACMFPRDRDRLTP